MAAARLWQPSVMTLKVEVEVVVEVPEREEVGADGARVEEVILEAGVAQETVTARRLTCLRCRVGGIYSIIISVIAKVLTHVCWVRSADVIIVKYYPRRIL